MSPSKRPADGPGRVSARPAPRAPSQPLPPGEQPAPSQSPSPSQPSAKTPPKAAALVALDIAQRIASHELSHGEPLPAERELVTSHGVSRAVVREAMRLLEVNGLVVIRRGASGGASAQAPDIKTTARHLAVVLQLGGCTVHDLDAALIALEPEALRLVSLRRRPEAMELLHSVLSETDRTDPVSVQAFHRAIPEATANLVVVRLFDLVAEIRVRHAQEAVRRSRRPADVLHDLSTAHNSHQRVLATVESGDADRAWGQWISHGKIAVRALAQDPSRSILDLFGPGSRFDWAAPVSLGTGRPRLPKGADIIAGELRQRIMSGELVAGDALPTEAELMRRYGMSRSPVREAIRILESDQLAVPLRGSHVGSRVGAPTDETVAWHFALSLECQAVRLADVLEAYQIVLRAAARMICRSPVPPPHERAGPDPGGSVARLLGRLDAAVGSADNKVLRVIYSLVRMLLPPSHEPAGARADRRLRTSSAALGDALARFEREPVTSDDNAAELWRAVADAAGPWLDEAFDPGTRVSAFPASSRPG